MFTEYFVTKLTNQDATPAMIAHAIAQMKQDGIVPGEPFTLTEIPYICYTSRIDPEINVEEFKGKIRFGSNVLLDSGLNNPYFSSHVHFTIVKTGLGQVGSIVIGNNVLLGPMVTIMDCDGHTLERRGAADELDRLTIEPVEIGEGAWIGMGAVLLKGVTIGRNSVVGINSVVTRSVPDFTVAAGNPARIIKRLVAE